MNADEFYEDFKDALKYLGLSWGQKDLAQVCFDGGSFCLSYGGRKTLVQLPSAQSQVQPPAAPTLPPQP